MLAPSNTWIDDPSSGGGPRPAHANLTLVRETASPSEKPIVEDQLASCGFLDWLHGCVVTQSTRSSCL